MSSEDAEARQLAMSHVDSHVPMALVGAGGQIPPSTEAPKPVKAGRLTPEEKQRRADERAQAREQAKAERAAQRVADKAAERNAKIAEAEGGQVELPAVVLRNGHVGHVTDKDAWAVISMYLDDMCLDVETSGYPVGHKHYELRTVQLGGEDAAVVFDASDPGQMKIASLALDMAVKLRAHSATADVVPCVLAGLINWDDAWSKMHDSVLLAKLTDPAMSGSDADALKELARDLLREYAVSPAAEKEKNELFKAMGCTVKTDSLTLPEKNGWYCVNRNSVVMIRYAGSDVLDLAAVIRVLPPLPVAESVLDREREFQTACAMITKDGFAANLPHIQAKVAEAELARAEAQRNVLILSDGKITNPKSPDVIKLLPEVIPGIVMPLNRKTQRPSADKSSLEKLAITDDALTQVICRQILEYRQQDTKLGLLLRPWEDMCINGDGRLRTTIYTIEASTGRTSSRRFNFQQCSREGGVRPSIVADPGYVLCNADFEGCEIRVAAALSGDKGLYEAEVSPFCWKCERDAFLEDPCSCGIKEEDGELKLKAHSGLHWRTAHAAYGKAADKGQRYFAKRGCFTKWFGGSAETAAAQVFCDVALMQKLFDAFDADSPGFTAWDKWMRHCYKEGMMVWRDYETGQNMAQQIEGKNRMIYRAYSGRNIYISNGAHAAGNGAIQGTARELLVDGVLRWRRGPWGHLPLLPVHDELLLWVKREEHQAATDFLESCMTSYVLSSPGFEVKIGCDPERGLYTYWRDAA